MDTTSITAHPEYTTMSPLVTQIRDVIKGSPFIKAKRDAYLPHPSSIDTDSSAQVARYNFYLYNAEFDEFTSNTERVMIGRMALDDAKFEPPSGLEYLSGDVDKDGLSMRGLIENCCKNVLEVKWHLLLSDYKGLSDLAIEEVSAQDIKDANPRATIKQYPRESVVDWDFARVNGAMQITYLLLCESGSEVDIESGTRTTVKSYLKLAIDDIGYYQQKRTESDTSNGSWGKKNYIKVGGSNLQFIPVSIACDEEPTGSSMPMELGYLAAIGDLALYRYRVSADYKEAMTALKPTLHVTGVDSGTWEEFKEINGRSNVASGAFDPNVWPGDNVKFELLESSQSLKQFTEFFEDNKNKVRALGGTFKTDNTVQRTATEVVSEAETITSVLKPVADNVESAIKQQIAYCAMLEGKVSPDAVNDYAVEVELYLTREFAVSKLTVDEVRTMLDVYLSGLLPKDEFLSLLELGGWTQSSAEDLIARLDEPV